MGNDELDRGSGRKQLLNRPRFFRVNGALESAGAPESPLPVSGTCVRLPAAGYKCSLALSGGSLDIHVDACLNGEYSLRDPHTRGTTGTGAIWWFGIP